MRPLDDREVACFFRNLGVLLLVALPLGVVSLVLNEFILTGSWQLASPWDIATPYFVALLPLAGGGALHQLVIMRLPDTWSVTRRRVFAIASSPLVLVVLLLIVELSYLGRFTGPIVVGLAVYGLILRIPPRGRSAENEKQKPAATGPV